MQIPTFALSLALRKVPPKARPALNLSRVQWLVSAEPVRVSTCVAFIREFAVSGVTAENFIAGYGMAEHVAEVSFTYI